MSAAPTRSLVTGGAGFIGSHLVERLLELRHHVRVVDNLATGHERNLESALPYIEFVEADLCDPAVAPKVVAGIDTVFHVAALPSVPRSFVDPWGSHEANVNATVRLLMACAAEGVRRVVYSSSSSAYGDTPLLPKVETAEPLPRSPYAAAKLAGEQYVLAFARAGRMEGVALRYFNVFGPRQDPNSAYAAVIPAFLQAALAETTATVNGDGKQTRDFTYVANVVEANVLAAVARADTSSGTVLNVGGGQRTSLLGLLELIRDVTGRAVAHRHGPWREGDVRDSFAALGRARRSIGYLPFVTVREGLQRTWHWFVEEHERLAAREPARMLAGAAGAIANDRPAPRRPTVSPVGGS